MKPLETAECRRGSVVETNPTYTKEPTIKAEKNPLFPTHG